MTSALPKFQPAMFAATVAFSLSSASMAAAEVATSIDDFFQPDGMTTTAENYPTLETARQLLIAQERAAVNKFACLLYTSPSPRDLSTSRMPSSA